MRISWRSYSIVMAPMQRRPLNLRRQRLVGGGACIVGLNDFDVVMAHLAGDDRGKDAIQGHEDWLCRQP